MAAPHIAGIVAQLFQANPAATPAQVEDALKTTAYKYADGAAYEQGPLGTTSFDKGYGLVDVVAAAAGGPLRTRPPGPTAATSRGWRPSAHHPQGCWRPAGRVAGSTASPASPGPTYEEV